MAEHRDNANARPGTSSGASITSSLKSPRAARFAEATSVNSPIEPSASSLAPFADISSKALPAPPLQPSDFGFGYIHENRSSKQHVPVFNPAPPIGALSDIPLKGVRSLPLQKGAVATIREEKLESQDAEDITRPIRRIRQAQVALRCTQFACSVVILALFASTLSIFNSTKTLHPVDGVAPWATPTSPWPQVALLVIASVSILISSALLFHLRRPRQADLKTTYLTIGICIFCLALWAAGAGILQGSRNSSNNNDIWSWSCKVGVAEELFILKVPYSLVCRLQNWSLILCLLQVLLEATTIFATSLAIYRLRSLARSSQRGAPQTTMTTGKLSAGLRGAFTRDVRDKTDGGYNPLLSPRFAPASEQDTKHEANTVASADDESADEEEYDAPAVSARSNLPFLLGAAPTPPPRGGDGFEMRAMPVSERGK